MFAVVSSGGKQYRVEPGSTVLVDRVATEPGASITFDRVLLIGDGDATTVGTPLVSGASVSGTVLGEELGPKLVIFKFKQKVKYRRRTGHRQHMSLVRIDAISADGRTTKAKPEPPAEAEAQSKPKARAKPKAAAKPVEAEASAHAEASAQADAPAATEEKPKRATRSRTAKPKAADAEASASSEEATTEAAAEKPKRRAPARTKKAAEAEE